MGEDGALFHVRGEDASFFLFQGDGVVVMNGLIKGESSAVRRVVDSAFSPLFQAGVGIHILVRTNFPSFTLPTPSVRYGILHTRKYLQSVLSILFVDLPSSFSPLFWVATKALPSYIRDKISLSLIHL